MSLSFRDLQKLCTANGIKPARGPGITYDVLEDKLKKQGILQNGKNKIKTLSSPKIIDKEEDFLQNKGKNKIKTPSPKIVDKEGDCPICLCSYNEGKVITTKCNHRFHYDCISNIRSLACPLCRTELNFPGIEKLKKSIQEKTKQDAENENIQFIRNYLVDLALGFWGAGYAVREITTQPNRSLAIEVINNFTNNQLQFVDLLLTHSSSQTDTLDSIRRIFNIR